MKLSIARDTLALALATIYRAADAKSTMFIHGNVYLKAVADRLELTTQGSTTAMRKYVIGSVIAEGETTVGARALHDVVKNAPGDDVMLEIGKNGWLVVKSGRSRFRLATMPPDDFPAFPEASGEELLNMPAQRFSDLLESVEYAALKDNGRPHLNSIHIQEHDEHLVATTTDGHRLARVAIDGECGGCGDAEMLLPMDAVPHIRRMIDGLEDDISITRDNRRLWFVLGDMELYVAEYDARFPPADKVIPMGDCHVCTLDAEELHDAVKRAMVIADSSSMVRFELSRGTIGVRSQTVDTAEAAEDVPVHAWSEDGSPSESYENAAIGANAKYIAEALGHVASEQVIMEYRGATSAIVFRPAPMEQRSRQVAVVMPMRV